jgi:hypothetical protein
MAIIFWFWDLHTRDSRSGQPLYSVFITVARQSAASDLSLCGQAKPVEWCVNQSREGDDELIDLFRIINNSHAKIIYEWAEPRRVFGWATMARDWCRSPALFPG